MYSLPGDFGEEQGKFIPNRGIVGNTRQPGSQHFKGGYRPARNS